MARGRQLSCATARRAASFEAGLAALVTRLPFRGRIQAGCASGDVRWRELDCLLLAASSQEGRLGLHTSGRELCHVRPASSFWTSVSVLPFRGRAKAACASGDVRRLPFAFGVELVPQKSLAKKKSAQSIGCPSPGPQPCLGCRCGSRGRSRCGGARAEVVVRLCLPNAASAPFCAAPNPLDSRLPF